MPTRFTIHSRCRRSVRLKHAPKVRSLVARALTLNEAAQRCDVSVVTLRRAIKAGTLRHEPRRSDRDPYQLTEEALEAAGYSVMPEVHPGWSVAPKPAPSDDARLLADLEAVRAEVAALRSERDTLLERVYRAEGELSATKRDFDVLASSLTPALNALITPSSRVIEAPADPPPLRGEPLERKERPRGLRRWLQRDLEAADIA